MVAPVEKPKTALPKAQKAEAGRPADATAATAKAPPSSEPRPAGDTATVGGPAGTRAADARTRLLQATAPVQDGAAFDAALTARVGKAKPITPAKPTAAAKPAGPPLAPPRDAQEARARAEALRDTQQGRPKPNKDKDEGPLGATFERDLLHAGARGTPAQQAGARQQLAANAQLEGEARAKLSPPQQAQYDALQSSLGNDPLTRLSLQTLLLEGKLTGEPPSKDGTDLLGELAQMNGPTRPIAGSLDRAQLVRGTIDELAFPESIAQREKSTCAATVVQTMLARRKPAEYARLVNGLAGTDDPGKLAPGQKAGQVTGPDGQPLQRPKGGALPDRSERTPSSLLLQGAFMERGNGAGLRYDRKLDEGVDKHTRKRDGGGLDYAQGDRLMRAIFPEAKHEAIDLKQTKDPKAREAQADRELDRIVRRAETSGTPTAVGVKWDAQDKRGAAHDEHAILVTKVQGDRVYYTNPWGREESMGRAEFRRRMIDVNHADF